jgi:hypothetical protein
MKIDNVGAIFMTQNSLTGVRSQHFDTGFHFVRENVEDGTVKVELKIPVKMHLTYSLRMSVKKPMIGMHWKLLRLLKILGVTERFGLGRLLDISLKSI